MTSRGDIPPEGIVLPLVTEEATISKREVVKGRALIHIRTDVVEERHRIELAREDVEIRHVAINRLVEPGAERPVARNEDGATVIPVLEEVAVVEKRLLLKEEIHILRHPRTEVAELPVTLRKQRIDIERLDPDGTSTGTTTEDEA